MQVRTVLNWIRPSPRSTSANAQGTAPQSARLHLESPKAVDEPSHVPSTEWRPLSKLFVTDSAHSPTDFFTDTLPILRVSQCGHQFAS